MINESFELFIRTVLVYLCVGPKLAVLVTDFPSTACFRLSLMALFHTWIHLSFCPSMVIPHCGSPYCSLGLMSWLSSIFFLDLLPLFQERVKGQAFFPMMTVIKRHDQSIILIITNRWKNRLFRNQKDHYTVSLLKPIFLHFWRLIKTMFPC